MWSWKLKQHGGSNKGIPAPTSDSFSYTRPQIVEALLDKRITSAAAGWGNWIALSDTGDAYTWGGGSSGCGGLGHLQDRTKPTRVGTLASKNVTSVSCGTAMWLSHVMVTTDTGCCYGWGSGSQFQLGNGKKKTLKYPHRVKKLNKFNVKMCSAGSTFSMAVLESGKLYTWGKNVQDGDMIGCLGIGDVAVAPFPTLVKSLEKREVIAISCGGSHAAAITATGELFTWGSGKFGATGHGDSSHTLSPKIVQGLLGNRILKVACGDAHTACINDEGKMWTFGKGAFGRLGHGSIIDEYLPVPVQYFSQRNIFDIACGGAHTLVLTGDGEVYSFGRGRNGQLGTGDNSDEFLPRLVEHLQGCRISSLCAGYWQSGAISDRGEVYVWGEGRVGILDDGDTVKVAGSDSGQLSARLKGNRRRASLFPRWITANSTEGPQPNQAPGRSSRQSSIIEMARKWRPGLVSAVQKIERMYGEHTIVRLGKWKPQQIPSIGTGSIGLDFALGMGGLPRGVLAEISGPVSSGKDILGLEIIAEAQRAEGTCAIIDCGHRINLPVAKSLGVKVEDLFVAQPQHVDGALDVARTLAESGAYDVVMIDAIQELVPASYLQGSCCNLNQELTATLNKLVPKVVAAAARTRCLVVCILNESVSSFEEKDSPQNASRPFDPMSLVKYHADVRIYSEVLGHAVSKGMVVGSQVSLKIIKNRLCPPFVDHVVLNVLFGSGIDRPSELVEMCVTYKVILQKYGKFIYGSQPLDRSLDEIKMLVLTDPDFSNALKKSLLDRLMEERQARDPSVEDVRSDNGSRHDEPGSDYKRKSDSISSSARVTAQAVEGSERDKWRRSKTYSARATRLDVETQAIVAQEQLKKTSQKLRLLEMEKEQLQEQLRVKVEDKERELGELQETATSIQSSIEKRRQSRKMSMVNVGILSR